MLVVPYTFTSALQTSGSDLVEFVLAHHKLVTYLDTLTPYLQLRLDTYTATCNVHVKKQSNENVRIQSSERISK